MGKQQEEKIDSTLPWNDKEAKKLGNSILGVLDPEQEGNSILNESRDFAYDSRKAINYSPAASDGRGNLNVAMRTSWNVKYSTYLFSIHDLLQNSERDVVV